MTSLNDYTLPGRARVWIYQSSRFFTPEEATLIDHKINDFAASWHAHGDPLSAEIKILHDLFVVIAVDEMVAKASGCSIDKSVRLVKDLETELQVALTGRTTVAYLDENKKIQLIHFNELKEKVQNGNMDGNTIMFNNLVSTLEDMKNNWMVPVKDSWLNSIPA